MSSETRMLTYGPAIALGRLFNHNTDPDKERAHADRLIVLRAIRASYLMDYLADCGSPGNIAITDGSRDEPHMIRREEKTHYMTDHELESVEEAVERDLLEHATEEAKAEYRGLVR